MEKNQATAILLEYKGVLLPTTIGKNITNEEKQFYNSIT